MSDQYTPTGGQTIFPRINYLKTFGSRLEQRIKNGRVAMFFKRLFGDATLDLNFAKNLSLGDDVSGNNLVTFSRASTGTYVGSDGLIKTATVDEPRFDHDPVTGESLGLLVEEQRTNEISYSDDVNNVWWSKVNLTAPTLVSSVDNPLQNADTYRIRSNTSSSPHYLQRNQSDLLGADTAHTFSALVAPEGTGVDSGKIQFRIFQVGSATGIVNFDLNTGQSNPQNGLSGRSNSLKDWEIHDYGMEPYLNGWYRVWMTFQVTAAASSIGIASIDDINASDASGVYSYTGSGTGGYYVAGIQVEEGSHKTTIIQTSGSAITRTADVASITGANFSSWYNQSEGTVFSNTKVDRTVDVGGTSIWYVNNANRCFYRGYGAIGTNTSTQNLTFPNTAGVVSFTKTAIAIKANDHAGSNTNDSLRTAPNSPTTASGIQLFIGCTPSGSQLNAHISRLAYFPSRKTDQELIDLTT